MLEDDQKALAAAGVKGLLQLVVATHAGMITDEFERIVNDWFATREHPRFNRPYTEMAYRPMVELLGHLRANGFKTYIVSGGGIEFMRVISEQLYGIPPEQVIGSSGKLRYELRNGVPSSSACRSSTSSTTKRASRPRFRSSSAGGRLPPSATPTATIRCCNGPPPVRAAA